MPSVCLCAGHYYGTAGKHSPDETYFEYTGRPIEVKQNRIYFTYNDKEVNGIFSCLVNPVKYVPPTLTNEFPNFNIQINLCSNN